MKNKLPEGWKEVTLGEVAEFINGRAFKPSEWENKGKIIIRIQDLTGNMEDPNFTTKTFEERYLVRKGDLLISWSATLDAFIWDKEEGWLNQHIFKVAEKNGIIDKKYLFYLIKTKINEMKKNTHGSTMKHITKGNFESIKISLPPLPTQQKIVSILEKADRAKELRKEADELTKDFLKAVFMEMFGDLNTNNKEFPICYLSEVCEINPRKSELDEGYNEKVSFMTMADVGEEGQIYNLELRKFEDVNTGFTYFKKNDVLFAKITPCMENGKGAIAKIPTDTGFGSTEFHVLRPIKDKTTSEWIYYLLSLKQVREEAEKKMTVPTGFFSILKIPLPPLAIQNKFASIVKEVEAMKEQQKLSKDHIDDLFNALMQKAFRGELT